MQFNYKHGRALGFAIERSQEGMSGNKIIERLAIAAQQDVTRVDISGQTWVRKVEGFNDDCKFDGDFDGLRRMAQEHVESGELVLVTPQLMLQLIDLAEDK